MPTPKKEAEEQRMMPIPDMDWGQVVLNGGPPCFHVENRRFCGRAERWAAHGAEGFHAFVSFRAFFESQTPLCPVHRELDNRDALELTIGENNCVACSLNEREQLIDTLDRGTPVKNRADSVTELQKALDDRTALLDVMHCAQTVLTALNVADVQKESPLHLKLREAMIAYRAALNPR